MEQLVHIKENLSFNKLFCNHIQIYIGHYFLSVNMKVALPETFKLFIAYFLIPNPINISSCSQQDPMGLAVHLIAAGTYQCRRLTLYCTSLLDETSASMFLRPSCALCFVLSMLDKLLTSGGITSHHERRRDHATEGGERQQW